MKKLRVGILFGGRSAEHEVSIQSAKNVFEALDKTKYEPVLIGITKKGAWIPLSTTAFQQIASRGYQALPEKASTGKEILRQFSQEIQLSQLDVIFPILHGPYGEDGTMQGLLKTLDLPYVGAGVLGSAVGMDKDVMKRLLRDAGLPIGKFITFSKRQRNNIRFADLKKKLQVPFFVKPANLGSSVGVAKVSTEGELEKALEEAFSFDSKILIEEFIKGREIECSVLGNDDPSASVAGEVIPTHDFYDYDAKYLDTKGATLKIPADLSEDVLKNVQRLAIKTFQVLCCSGLARVDFFLTKENTLYVNEINTLPGFTKISMYPVLWQESGVGYSELLDRLIQLALDRFNNEQSLKTSF